MNKRLLILGNGLCILDVHLRGGHPTSGLVLLGLCYLPPNYNCNFPNVATIIII